MEFKPLPGYRFITVDPDLLGGKPTVIGTRLSVAFLLSCFAQGMTLEEIEATYGPISHEAVLEVFKFASEVLDARDVAA